jgi:hypothetical protein
MKEEFLILNVDTSIEFTKKEYIFFYKRKKFKYVPKGNKLDSLISIFKYNNGKDYQNKLNSLYKIMTEFLRVVSFEYNQSMIPRGYMWAKKERKDSLKNCNLSYFDIQSCFKPEKTFKVDCEIDCIESIPDLKNKEDIDLIRLFIYAENTNNLYAKILFFWHSLVYPEKNKDKAIEYINEFRRTSSEECFDEMFIKKNPYFSKSSYIMQDENGNYNIGGYIYAKIKSAISHITRNTGDGKNLDLDNLEEIEHLTCVCRLLRKISRYRIEQKIGQKKRTLLYE